MLPDRKDEHSNDTLNQELSLQNLSSWDYVEKDRPAKDLLIVFIVSLIGTIILININAFEKFHELTRQWEDFDLDEITMGFILLAICLSWFSFRRWKFASREVDRRKGIEIKLQEAFKGELLDAAHKAGMAEVAVGVLHNVGNVLNSVGVTTSSMNLLLKNSRLNYLSKVVDLLNLNKHDLASFMQYDKKGKQLPDFLSHLLENLQKEQNLQQQSLDKLNQYVQHIAEIINLQYSYSKTCGTMHKVQLHEIMEDAVMINSEALIRHHITLERQYDTLAPAFFDRSGVLQILTNLISNAKYALSISANKEKLLLLRITKNGNGVKAEVIDNGIGIDKKHMKQIFNFGFTTKKGGHGFGLHSGSLSAINMGGSLKVKSDGAEKGAAFTLELPFIMTQTSNENNIVEIKTQGKENE